MELSLPEECMATVGKIFFFMFF
uniref:39s ribosomal protein mitochondrial n=1 Tax=Triatoma infestans TaxID=30076 RepID=A0A161MTI7_TRIIF